MNKTIEKITKELEKEKEKLKSLNAKKKELNAEIKAKEADITALENQLQSEKLNMVASALSKSGTNVDELLTAALSGDFLTLQEKLEENNKSEADITIIDN